MSGDTINTQGRVEMIHVKIGVPHTQTEGRTLEIIEVDPMLVNYKQYDTIIINDGHEQQNLKVFANLCKGANIRLLVSGEASMALEDLRDIADVYED